MQAIVLAGGMLKWNRRNFLHCVCIFEASWVSCSQLWMRNELKLSLLSRWDVEGLCGQLSSPTSFLLSHSFNWVIGAKCGNQLMIWKNASLNWRFARRFYGGLSWGSKEQFIVTTQRVLPEKKLQTSVFGFRCDKKESSKTFQFGAENVSLCSFAVLLFIFNFSHIIAIHQQNSEQRVWMNRMNQNLG